MKLSVSPRGVSFLPPRTFAASLFFLLPLFAPAAEAEDLPPLELSFTGDLIAHAINYQMKDYDKIYRGLEGLLLEDDLTFGNVEFPMDPRLRMVSFPRFNIHPSFLEAFIDAGLDVFSIANNHSADMGRDSLVETVKTAEDLIARGDRPLYFSGASRGALAESSGPEAAEPAPPWGPNLPDFSVTQIEAKGWKIGFLAITQISNVSPGMAGLLYLADHRREEEREALLAQVALKAADYDLFILSYHGGDEYRFASAPGKRQFFEALIEAGVDIVWGHHPHVLQEMELVETPGGTKVILHSLGNFLSGQGRIIDEALPEEDWSYTGDSAIVQIRVERNAQGDATIRKLTPIGVANYITPNREVLLYPLETLATMPLPDPWGNFYRERRRLMEGFFEKKVVTTQSR